MNLRFARAALIGAGLLILLCSVLLPAARADFSFVHITDTHFTTSTAKDGSPALNGALFDEIRSLSPKPLFVVHTGDICEEGTPDEYAVYRKALSRLKVRVYAAPGNHDVRWNPFGKVGFQQGAGQPLYQSWDYENVHFILLDSTVLLEHWGHFNRAELTWLQQDLQKVGPQKPIIVGFHNYIYRPGEVQVDNTEDLMKILAPYNVRLFLLGHGHSDLQWSINGIPAIEAKGLYQGSYHLIQVTADRLTVYRRTSENPTTKTVILSTPLARTLPPLRQGTVSVDGNVGTVKLIRYDIPADAVCTFRVNASSEIPMQATPEGFEGKFQFLAVAPGDHLVTITATLPDKRAYQTVVPLHLENPEGIKPLWHVNVGSEVQSRLVRDGDVLYVPTMGGDLVALEAATGKERWRYRTGAAIFSVPLVVGKMVIFGSGDGVINAIETATGKVRWRTPTAGPVFAGAAFAGNVVCIASADKKIYGLDLETGHVLWTAQTNGLYQSQAATDGAHFFLGGWDNAFRCLDAKTGNEVWTQKFGRNARHDLSFYYAPAIGSPIVGGGKVYVTSNDGLLHAIDIDSGNVLWEVNGPSLGYSGPLYHAGQIYNASLTAQGRVFCFDEKDGHKVWEQPTGSVIYDSSCAFGHDNVFVGSVDGTFSALRASDGALQWQYRLPAGHLLASPAADDDHVYIGSMNGEVFCFPTVVTGH